MSDEDPNTDANGSHVDGIDGDPSEERDEIEELRRRIEALQFQTDKRLRAFVRESPLLALGAAVAAGFILARAIRRL